jgi:hypothetical protein
MHISLSLTPHQTGVCLFEDAALGGSGAGWRLTAPSLVPGYPTSCPTNHSRPSPPPLSGTLSVALSSELTNLPQTWGRGMSELAHFFPAVSWLLGPIPPTPHLLGPPAS